MKKTYILATVSVYAIVFAWVFVKNLAADTDYPYHLHAVWAVNQGHLLRDPFLNRGNSFTPEVYENLIAKNVVMAELREGYVRYSGDGSALYFLPLAGVRLSNSGALPFEMRLENDPLLFCKRMAEENASFVLVYSESPEENYLLQLNFPLFYSQEKLRIYKVPQWVGRVGDFGPAGF
ncbi:MAG: hypothetical protein DSO04_07285 [Hadesarchaea archaeon]|nr:MAG: hypothetical protein DSO04_07285 [Hadesarchaea archaeon]